MSKHTKHIHIPMPFPNESDADYDKRLKKLGISDEDFEAAFNEDFPPSESDVNVAVFHDGDMDDDNDRK